jgi:Ca2+-binding EF-hand superfamily protein
MKKILCLLAASGLAVLAMPVAAGNVAAPQRGDFAERMFNRMDANGDGVITRKEFEDYNGKRFDELDTNHDGKVSRAEMEAARDKARKKLGEQLRRQFDRRFDAADANHDGALNRDEAQQMPWIAQRFDAFDANHDGKVTRDEVRDYMSKVRGNRRGGMQGGGLSE